MRLLQTSNSNISEINKEKNKNSYHFEFDILSEAIPYIKLYEGQTMVICFDELLLDDYVKMTSFAQDIVLLKNAGINPIIIHDASHNIIRYLDKFNIEYALNEENEVDVNTTNIDLVEMVCHLVNKRIVSHINNAGGLAIGISGKDGKLIEARKIKTTTKKLNDVQTLFNANLEGVPVMINPDILSNFDESEFIPIISSIGFNDNCAALYLNPEDVASMVASSLAACKIIIMMEEDIFLDEEGKIIEEISSIQAKLNMGKSFKNHAINKIKSALAAIDNYTESAHFVNSNVEHGLIFEILSDNRPGTMIYPVSI
ncbi:MAG: acetylglutamate kinase [Sphingobacteriia bacterium]|nr:acetylglutamate kinase [Sphingobacteriia bacterium]